MIIKSVKFVISAASTQQMIHDGVSQIVLCGRSNVGKSSFINSLLNQKSVARVSQTPGKTRLINYFLINDCFYFVDIPGYGYARVTKEQYSAFQERIESYLQRNPSLKVALLLLDIRRKPNNDDLLMQAYFQSLNIPIIYVLTKVDKVSNNVCIAQKQQIMATLNIKKDAPVIPYSILTKTNREQIWERLTTYLPELGKGENQ
ncbi:MAG: ribosome biogenesis GTP-binding protein YihA/YsxC [Candidatus Izemoplasmatales bacterium]|jgi:GTP-binding protein|nr:ribosome biogenesis GTP-binding protein YihA/YsxC [Candidatus Izemoplasmatales bacterium]MDD4355050.1 ribosome biogenesis GTP-binding protein YihA/YsxC [Candidatus Izemoplasmatales bacterium]MDD4987337.1 ribosome biogenesis GTP-binding protein YihA/YsxC [Candidatus Izemoplasmatales bacterium]MDY0374081.1 ribosome biogenesis GTP-binding protein YihA/YsxC [Candidatus Izemoplasmatales bacterium]NLF49256.1 YihA family ribosome biogenesis GTP-binding protein [Acholeplasmataceae bacterium]